MKDAAIGGDALVDLGSGSEQRLGLLDSQLEELGAVLVADAEDVGEAAGGEEGGFCAAAGEQGVGAAGGSEAEGAGRDGLVEAEAEEEANGEEGGFFGGEELVGELRIADFGLRSGGRVAVQGPRSKVQS